MTSTKVVVAAVVGALVAALTLAPASAQRSADEQPPTVAPGLPSVDELAARADGDGAVSVIVGLDVPTTPEGALAPADLGVQRGRIAEVRDDVLDDVRGTATTVTHEYESLPFVALRTDRAGLDALVASGSVSGIYDDTPVPPALETSTPVVRAPQAHALGYTGGGKTIAVLDTGVLANHPFLSGKVVSEACYSKLGDCPNGQTSMTGAGAGRPCDYSVVHCPHGTHVAGIAAGKAGAGGGAPAAGGVAKDADIIAINVFSESSPGKAGSYPSDQIKGLERVYHLHSHLDIAAANLSLSGGLATSYCDAFLTPTKAAIDLLRSVGIPTVVATGNDAQTAAIGAPACISSAVSVGSTTDGDLISAFSNQSFQVNLVAPGSSITSSVCTGGSCGGAGYAAYNGTSMATPHVAGAMAILDQKAGRDTVGRKVALLHETGEVVTDTSQLKYSRIDIEAALANMPATPPDPNFADVPPSHPFFADIAWGASEEIVGGFDDGTFRPQGTLNRDAMVAYLYRLAGEPTGTHPDPGFSDVPPGHTFHDEIAWAVAEGVTAGYPDGTFRPGEPVTRSAMATFLWRLQDEPTSPLLNGGYPLPDPDFDDVGGGHLFRKPIAWAAYYEITRGYPDGSFRPGAAMTRQEAVAFLYRYVPLEIRP